MQRIIGALRGELANHEATELIVESAMSNTTDKARQLWVNILKAEAEEIRKLWPKRKKQILSGKSKYCQEIDRKNEKIRITNIILKMLSTEKNPELTTI